MRWTQGVLLLSLGMVLLVGACRRNTPSLVDRNEPPETELWYSPPDSTEYEYLVHMYWRGRDNDGTVEQYIWTIQDTLVLGETSWNPSTRLRDYRSGRITTKSDSIFSFTAFRDIGGVGVKKSRQAFYISSVDDNGVIDPSPAAVEFVATIDQLPLLAFSTQIEGVWRPYVAQPPVLNNGVVVLAAPRDTVGMYRPFAIGYGGTRGNGDILGYHWFPLSTTVDLPGARMWTTNLTDTLRTFTNQGAELIPAGTFRFAAKCIDEAGAESEIDGSTFQSGVAEIQVNFDADTRIHNVQNNYTVPTGVLTRTINFADAIPDTVAYQSWTRLDYSGWDDARDVRTCPPATLNPDRCIDFQVRYTRVSSRINGSSANSGWLPPGGVHDTDPSSATDSNTINMGSLEYSFYVRAIDENGTPDGTPATVSVIGNYDPTLDSTVVVDHKFRRLDLSKVDTLTWNFNSPARDTFEIVDGVAYKVRTYSFRIKAFGHDDPREIPGSGIKAWRYFMFKDFGTPQQVFLPLIRAGDVWNNGFSLNVMNDQFELTFRYPATDFNGDTVFALLPAFGYFDKTLTVEIMGRDTAANERSFDQYVFLNGTRSLNNSFPAAALGRYTASRMFSFYFRMKR